LNAANRPTTGIEKESLTFAPRVIFSDDHFYFNFNLFTLMFIQSSEAEGRFENIMTKWEAAYVR
jgi:hypothetical protein